MSGKLRDFGRFLLFTILLAAPTLPSFAADIRIPALELMTWGRMDDGGFGLFSRAYLELLVEGGSKFGGRVELMLEDENLEDGRSLPDPYDPDEMEQVLQKYLLLKSVSFEIKRLFETPINLVYFSGTTDVFASGDVFPRIFESDPVASLVRGYRYFPTGVIYDGIHTVRGTGFKIHAPGLAERFNLAVYTYQDEYFGRGKYSSDIRAVYNSGDLKIETFVGATYPDTDMGIYRAGLLFFYSTGLGGEFFTQIGIPRWDPLVDDKFTTDLFYLLFEPRVRMDLFSIVLTFFWHPEYYNQVETNESGTLDLFIRFAYGDLGKTSYNLGVENQLTLQTRAGDQMAFRVSPYLSLVTSGIAWDFRVNFKLHPYRMSELFETFIGIKTEL